MKMIFKRPLTNQSQTGFTLVEVMVALTVVTLALVALMKGAGSIAANTAYLKEKNIASWIAMDRIMELENEKGWPDKGTDGDTVEMLGTEWSWTQKVTDIPDYKDMRRIEVSVIQADGDEEYPLVTLVSFAINPDIMK